MSKNFVLTFRSDVLRKGQRQQVVNLPSDDVLASGATASACAAALKAAGAVAVDVLVAARVPDPRLEGGISA